MKKTIVAILAVTSLLGYANSGQTANKERGVSADNTEVNKRDASDRTLTADDQNNNAKNLEVVSKIRSDLVNDSNLSTYAKNVKIVVLGGEVTLRGPVNSQAEKEKIANVASLAAPSMRVQNKLEVVK